MYIKHFTLPTDRGMHGVYCDPDPDAAAKQALKDAEFARDSAVAEAAKLKAEIDKLKGQVLSDDDRKAFDKLKTDAAHAEEERAKKAGEFDSLKTQLIDKHNDELAKERAARETAETKLRTTVIGREFAAATDLFGTDKSKTILTHDIAESYFGKYVDLDESGAVVVKNTSGQVILDAKTGKPATFAMAMGELIGTLPNKDNILRGSGKPGSGSSGGADRSTENGQIDTSKLKAADFKDPKVREAVKAQHAAAGGVVMGAAFAKK